jgi:hypothetical protein
MLPHEHGAWAMFAMPLLVGLGATHSVNGEAALFALTAFCFFLLRYPLMWAIKSRAPDVRHAALRWSAIYAAVTGISGVWLLLVSQIWELILIGAFGLGVLAIYLLLAARRAEMSTAGEWIGIAGLALGAPGMYLASSGRLDSTAFALYAVNLLYFGGTVSYIKFKVREQPRAAARVSGVRARLWTGRATLAYHALLLLVGASFAAIGFVPALTAVAFCLPMCKVVAGIAARPARTSLPRLGFIELGVTLAFALVILAAYG